MKLQKVKGIAKKRKVTVKNASSALPVFPTLLCGGKLPPQYRTLGILMQIIFFIGNLLFTW
jgi:hypothetical protein